MQWQYLFTIIHAYSWLGATHPLAPISAADTHCSSGCIATVPASQPDPIVPFPGYRVEGSLNKRMIPLQLISHGFMRSPNTGANAWMLKLRLVSAVLPAQVAANALETFYDRMIIQVHQELTSREYNGLSWQSGGITFELHSRDPRSNIPFSMVYNLLKEMRAFTTSSLVGTYEGEVVSTVTGLSIWLSLRIAGLS